MYKVIIQRVLEINSVKKQGISKVESSTIGILQMYDNKNRNMFTCVTVENGGESTNEPNKDRRILSDNYGLEWSNTSVKLPEQYRGRGLLLTHHKLSKKVDSSFNKRRIFIHIGNYPQDSEGCILLNKSYDFNKNAGYGILSTAAVGDFYSIISKIPIADVVVSIHEINSNLVTF